MLVDCIHHHYDPSAVNRSAVMDLHRSRSCATLIQSLSDIFVQTVYSEVKTKMDPAVVDECNHLFALLESIWLS